MRAIPFIWTFQPLVVVAYCLICAWIPESAIAQQEPFSTSDAVARETTAEIRHLIERLADDDFQVRQDSEYRLKQIGPDAIAVLEQHRHAGDSELRLSVVRLIAILRRDYLASQTERFLARQTTLPGWSTYSAVAGDDDETREMFVQLFRHRQSFFESFDADGSDQTPDLKLQTMMAEFLDARRRQPTPDSWLMASIAMQIIKVFSDDREKTGVPERLQMKVRFFFQQPHFHVLFSNDPYQKLHRAAVVRWIRYDDHSPIMLPSRVDVARRLKLAEGLIPAVKCLALSDEIPSATRQVAITMIAKYGDETHIPLLATQLDQNHRIFSGPLTNEETGNKTYYKTQIGDLALSSMVFLARKDFRDFGFTNLSSHDASTPLPVNLSGFSTDEARHAARQKWKED